MTILANRETPCVRSPRSLLVCALARSHLGETARARASSRSAPTSSGWRATATCSTRRGSGSRSSGATSRRRSGSWRVPLPDRGWHRAWLLLSSLAARLDALAALGRRAEVEAWQPPRRGTYLEPFLLRALGLVREDEALLARAAAGLRGAAARLARGADARAPGIDLRTMANGELTRRAIDAQPEWLARVPTERRLPGGPRRLHRLRHLVPRGARPGARRCEALEAALAPPDADVLVLLSHEGKTAVTLAAARAFDGPRWLVTGTPDGPIAELCDEVVVATPALEESYCHTASYTCAVAAIRALQGEDVSGPPGGGRGRARGRAAGR